MAAWMFQSSSLPKKGCNHMSKVATPVKTVSILIPPEEGMQQPHISRCCSNCSVSILIPPEEGMQRASPTLYLLSISVSILIPPEEGMQPSAATTIPPPYGSFNPHPSRRRDATYTRWPILISDMFQSSSLPKKGCNANSDADIPWISRFNPHPSRRRDATILRGMTIRTTMVSILIPPEEGMQLTCTAFQLPVRLVSILIPPEEGMQPVVLPSLPRPKVGFNPHPSRRRDATWV